MRALGFAIAVAVLVFTGGCLCGDISDLSKNYDGGEGGGSGGGAAVGGGASVGGGSSSGGGSAIGGGSATGGGSVSTGGGAGTGGGTANGGGTGTGGGTASGGGGVDAGPSCDDPPGFDGGIPIAWWPLDEGDGGTTADKSLHGISGTLINGPTWVPGHCGSALLFSVDGGNPYVNFGNPNSLKIDGPITLSAWFQLYSFPPNGTSEDLPILSKRGTQDRGWQLYIDEPSLVFSLPINSVDWLPDYGPDVQLMTWYHGVAVYDPQATPPEVRMYLNGILQNTVTMGFLKDGGAAQVPAHMHNSTSDVHLGNTGGCTQSNCDQNFRGAIDEVRIYDTALTDDQVKALP